MKILKYILLSLIGLFVCNPSTMAYEEYSFVHISDTQYLSESLAPGLNVTFQYINSIKQERNIVAIFNTGDLVRSMYNEGQWKNYTSARNTTTIPVYECTGNHDIDGNNYPNYTEYLTHSSQHTREYNLTLKDFILISTDASIDTYHKGTWNEDSINLVRGAIAKHPDLYPLILIHPLSVDGMKDKVFGSVSGITNKDIYILYGHDHDESHTQYIVNNSYIYTSKVIGGESKTSAFDLYSVKSDNGKIITINLTQIQAYPNVVIGKTSQICPITTSEPYIIQKVSKGCDWGKSKNPRNCDIAINSTLLAVNGITKSDYLFRVNTQNNENICYFDPDTKYQYGCVAVTEQVQDVSFPKHNNAIASVVGDNLLIVRSK